MCLEASKSGLLDKISSHQAQITVKTWIALVADIGFPLLFEFLVWKFY
jgi:hypothetical protein